MCDFSSNLSYFFAGLLTFFGALTLQELSFGTGLVLGLATFAVNWHYKRKHFLLLARSEAQRKQQ